MLVLGIESSHDDTSIALVENKCVIFNYKISQTEIHKKFGGTVPEIASREHYNNFYVLLSKMLENKKFINNIKKIDYIAYTEEPGLIGALQMGKLFAHSLAKTLNIPIKSINHLDGHIFSTLLTNINDKETKEIEFPAFALVVSGGHTNMYYLENEKTKELIGQTLDDAAGEVFDKVARTLELGFPGGPIIDKLFYKYKEKKDIQKVDFKWPKTENKLNFSFSGFKTQVLNINKKGIYEKEIIAYSFQKNVVDYIISVIKYALEKYSNINTLILSGGVSANKYLREEFNKIHSNVLLPKIEYSTDNGAMIAIACIEELK